MRFFTALVFFILSVIAFNVSAQPVAVITHLQHEVKLYSNVRSVLSEESFPNYFAADTAWTASVVNKIKMFVAQKTDAKKIAGKETIYFTLSNKSTISATPFNENDTTNADYSVTGISTINLLTTSMDKAGMLVKNFNLTCIINIRDKKGDPVLSSKVIAPFRTMAKAGIMHGLAELGQKDFKAFYEQTLHAAFENKIKKLPVSSFYRPPFEGTAYNSFLTNANYYLLQESLPEVPLQKGEGRNSQLIFKSGSGIIHNTMKFVQSYIGNPDATDGTFHTRATLKNDLSQTTYQVWASLNTSNADSNDTYPHKQAKINIRCTEKGLLAGDYVLSSNKFEGNSGYEVYNINRIAPKSTIELRVNNQLKAIMQKGGVSGEDTRWQNYYIYFSKDLHTIDIGNLLNVILIYKMAYDFGQDYIAYY